MTSCEKRELGEDGNARSCQAPGCLEPDEGGGLCGCHAGAFAMVAALTLAGVVFAVLQLLGPSWGGA